MEKPGKIGQNTGVDATSVCAAAALSHTDAEEAREDMTTPTSKRTTSPAFQFYPKDFLTSSKVIAMSISEVGAYIKLLCLCWLDGSIPAETKSLARLVGVSAKAMASMWPALQGCFVSKSDGRLINKRLDVERRKQADYRQQQKERAERRWDKPADAGPAMPGHSVGNAGTGNALQSPISDLQSPISKTRDRSLVARRNLRAAYEGPRGLYVLHGQHRKFVDLLNGQVSEAVLFTWYEKTAESWATGARAGEMPDANMPAFWDKRFQEQWPPAQKDRLHPWQREVIP